MTDSDTLHHRLTHSGLGAESITRHLQRLQQGEVDEADLRRYAGHLDHLTALTGGALAAAFWDHETEALRQSGKTVYSFAAEMVMTAPYVRLLADAHRRFHALQTAPAHARDALMTAVDLLRLSTTYIVAGHPTAPLTVPLAQSAATAPPTPAGMAIYLWQRLVTGSTRSIRGQEPYTHGIYAHHNVVAMHHFSHGTPLDPSDAWGLSGLKAKYIGDRAVNRNQFEHLAISAVLQKTIWPGWLTLPMLNWVEVMQWVLQKDVNYAHARADIAINNAAHMLTRLDVDAPHDLLEKLILRLQR